MMAGSTFDRLWSQLQSADGPQIANIVQAYQSGKMRPDEAAQFEGDVKSGRVMLPIGVTLKNSRAASAAVTLPLGVARAYADGSMPDSDRMQLESDLKSGLVKMPEGAPLGPEGIPLGVPGVSAPPAPVQHPQQPESISDKLIGTAEAGLTALTGATGGQLGMIGGTLKGLAEQILSGQFGTPQAANLIEQQAAQGAQALTYAPRTQSGQEQAQVLGEAMQQLVPVAAVLPGMAPATSGLSRAARPTLPVAARAGAEGVARDVASAVVAPAEAAGIVPSGSAMARGEAAAGGMSRAIDTAGAAADRAATAATSATQRVTTIPRRAMDSALSAVKRDREPTPGTQGSAGAAGTDIATQRRATAEELGFSGDTALTTGQATRDPAQLNFEVETAKDMAQGAKLRQRTVAQNQRIFDNLDQWVDQTGAKAPDLRATGQAVDAALVAQSKRDKAAINVAYARARKSPEASAPIDTSLPVALGSGDDAITSTPFDYINSQPRGLPSTGLVDAARQYAQKLGIADDVDGTLVPRPATVKQMEEWRSAISQHTGYEPVDIRQSTIIKGLIDGQTEPVAGPLYQQARALRAKYAQQYEDIGAVHKLLNTRRGTSDRMVALEDVHKHAILDGSYDDVAHVQKLLGKSGEAGKQAWKELQGATIRWIQGQAFGRSVKDARGTRVVSPAGLDNAVKSLDVGGKLDLVLGKREAQRMRDMRDLAIEMRTVPPEAAINTSNTAATILGALADAGMSGTAGVPLPVVTLWRATRGYIKDKALAKRIDDALAGAPLKD